MYKYMYIDSSLPTKQLPMAYYWEMHVLNVCILIPRVRLFPVASSWETIDLEKLWLENQKHLPSGWIAHAQLSKHDQQSFWCLLQHIFIVFKANLIRSCSGTFKNTHFVKLTQTLSSHNFGWFMASYLCVWTCQISVTWNWMSRKTTSSIHTCTVNENSLPKCVLFILFQHTWTEWVE